MRRSQRRLEDAVAHVVFADNQSEDEAVSVELYQPGWVTRVGLPLGADRGQIRSRTAAALQNRAR